jgi:ribonuclease D
MLPIGSLEGLSMGKPVYVTSTAQLKECSAKLLGAQRYFIDTEFEITGPAKKLCLVQVATGADETFLIDTIALTALEPLAGALFRPDAEWVLHAGNQDVALLREVLHFEGSPRLFDTQVAWGLIGPEYPVSLAYLLYRMLGTRSAKNEQAGPWAGRPLTPEQLEYAAGDVEYLPALRDRLSEQLKKSDREALVYEVSAETILPEPFEPLSLDEFRNAWQLDASGQAALKFLIEWWNTLPSGDRLDAPQPRTFLTLAKLLPETGSELAKVRGIFFPWVKRHGDSFTGKLVRASAAASREGFVPLEPPPYTTFERILNGAWIRKAAAETCAELSLAPELAFPERVIRRMIEAVEASKKNVSAAAVLTGWRDQVLRKPFLERSPA